MRNKGLLSATFEQSKKVVSKKILTENGAQIGSTSSMSFSQRTIALIAGLFLIGLYYAVGVGLPRLSRWSQRKPECYQNRPLI